MAASIIGPLSAAMWAAGLSILTEGLKQISVTLRNHVWFCGLFMANIGLLYMVAMPLPEHWVSYVSWSLWPMCIGMLGGIVSDRKTFLAQ